MKYENYLEKLNLACKMQSGISDVDSSEWQPISEEQWNMLHKLNLQSEISNEEIYKQSQEYSESFQNKGVAMTSFIQGCYWYREKFNSKIELVKNIQ